MIRPVSDQAPRRAGYWRAPADSAAVGTLLRIATCIGGMVEVVVNCLPLFDFGVNRGEWTYDGDRYDSMLVQTPTGDPILRIFQQSLACTVGRSFLRAIDVEGR